MINKIRRYYIIVPLVSLAVLCVASFFIYHSYREALSLVKEQFFEQQNVTTIQTAHSIEETFRLLERELEQLSLDPALRRGDKAASLKAMEREFRYVKDLYVNDISRSDADGIVRVNLHSPELVGRDFSFREYFKKLQSQTAAGPAYELITFQGIKKGDKGIIIAQPVFSGSGKFDGAVLFIVEVTNIIKGRLLSLPKGVKGWVADGDGLVLYHPEIPVGARMEAGPESHSSYRVFIESLKSGPVQRSEYLKNAGASAMTMATVRKISVAGENLVVVLEQSEDKSREYLRAFSINYFVGVSVAAATIISCLIFFIVLISKGKKELEREVNERMDAEKRMREGESRFSQFIEYAPMAMAVVDEQGNIVYLNRKFTDTFGYTAGMIPTVEKWFMAAYPDAAYRDSMEKRWRKYLDMSRSISADMRASEYNVTDVNGNAHIMEINGSHIGDRHFIIFGDVTERKRLEHQLQHVQKMDCFGQLAGGIAHDFNNILSAIIGYGEIIQETLGPDHPARPYADIILSASNSGARLINSLLAFSRKQILNPQPLRLNDQIRNMQRILTRLIGEHITIETSLSEAEPEIIADHGQVEQVLMNLATNARDAMPHGGTINIATFVVELDRSIVERFGYGKPGTYAALIFSDIGSGMPLEVQDKIFEPFFTTKEIGRGTGLGLSIVYGIIKQHNGYIDVSSTPGQGTTFTIYLPASRSMTGPAGSSVAEGPEPEFIGHHHILVAEDDANVRGMIKKVLEDAGYEVTVVADGEAALRIFRENDNRVDMLITDVIMPNMNGREMYDRIRLMRPGLRVLFMSGHAPELIRGKGILKEDTAFLAKPFSKHRLLEKVREILGTRDTGKTMY